MIWNADTLIEMGQHLLVALLAGGVIGLERTWNGRAAGFRTHVLVSVTSALLMLVTLYQGQWFGQGAGGVNTDPTRMAQGIMTGIGFLGAGVIMKDGLAVRGLTTAASIWISAALGILAGVGLYIAVLAGVALALIALAAFRIIEQVFPTRIYTQLEVVYELPASPASEEQVRQAFQGVGIGVSDMACAMDLCKAEQAYTITLITGRSRPDAQVIFKSLQQTGSIMRLRVLPA